MDTLEAISTRRAVRAYTEQAVDEDAITALLLAATQAPSAVNEQPWAFTVIQDRDLLDRYSERAKTLMLRRREMATLDIRFREMVASPTFDIFYRAGTLIVIWATPGGVGGERAAWDCCFAAQNLMLAAHARGLGTCPIGFAWPLLETSEVKEELNVPDDFLPVLPLVVGFPHGETPPVPRRAPDIRYWK